MYTIDVLDVQHPLLKKYGFDIFDFALGARHAVRETTLISYSKEFVDYCQK